MFKSMKLQVKYLISLIIVLFLAIMLVSCGGEETTSDTNQVNSKITGATSATDTEAERQIERLQERVDYLRNQLDEFQSNECQERKFSLKEIYTAELEKNGYIYLIEIDIDSYFPKLSFISWISDNPFTLSLKEQPDGTYTGTFKEEAVAFEVSVDTGNEIISIPFIEEGEIYTEQLSLNRIYKTDLRVRGKTYPLEFDTTDKALETTDFCSNEKYRVDAWEQEDGTYLAQLETFNVTINLDKDEVSFLLCPC